MEFLRAKDLVSRLERADLLNTVYGKIDTRSSPTYRRGKHLKSFKIARNGHRAYWLTVVIWSAHEPNNWYLVIRDSAHPRIAEIHEVSEETQGSIGGDLIWTFAASKQKDKERNPARDRAFEEMAGSKRVVISLPDEAISVSDFLDDVFALADMRLLADQGIADRELRASASEGRRVERLQKHIERDAGIARRAKAQYEKNGRWPCQACGFEFGEMFGVFGTGYIEAHHKVDLAVLTAEGAVDTSVDDFNMLCSNCHRMIHITTPAMTLDELKAIIESARS